jgi:hypothetical protein
MTNPDQPSAINDPATRWRQDLEEFPPAVIPDPHRHNPDVHPDIPGPMHGTDGDNRSVAPDEGTGACGSVLDGEKIEFADDDGDSNPPDA